MPFKRFFFQKNLDVFFGGPVNLDVRFIDLRLFELGSAIPCKHYQLTHHVSML